MASPAGDLLPTGGDQMMSSLTREPAWSGPLTRPLGKLLRPEWRPAALYAIKAIHTLIFASVGAAIALFVWDGLREQPQRRSAYAFGIFVGESVVYMSNNQVCPLTPLAEDLGAGRGAVVDMFLPPWAASRIPVVGTGAALLGVALHGRTILMSRQRTPIRATVAQLVEALDLRCSP